MKLMFIENTGENEIQMTEFSSFGKHMEDLICPRCKTPIFGFEEKRIDVRRVDEKHPITSLFYHRDCLDRKINGS